MSRNVRFLHEANVYLVHDCFFFQLFLSHLVTSVFHGGILHSSCFMTSDKIMLFIHDSRESPLFMPQFVAFAFFLIKTTRINK